MKLSKEDIQFIDNYLQGADIKHIDIRLEMIDHVATAIETKINQGDEREFYYVFKDYMVENKARLINRNKKIIKTTDKKLAIRFLSELFRWQSIFWFLFSFILLNFLLKNISVSVLHEGLSFFPIFGFGCLAIWYTIAKKKLNLGRFSDIERLGIVCSIVMYVLHFSWNFIFYNLIITTPEFTIGLLSFTILILVAITSLSIKLINENKEKYKMLLN